jgi:hypothetical protein
VLSAVGWVGDQPVTSGFAGPQAWSIDVLDGYLVLLGGSTGSGRGTRGRGAGISLFRRRYRGRRAADSQQVAITNGGP